VIELPQGATPLDLAYAIHSDVGGHASGAKVNNKMVSLDYILKNGDIVQIETKKTSHPTAKWLDLVKTGMARKHIKAAVQKFRSTKN
jgi:GTP pyrophosphokinase